MALLTEYATLSSPLNSQLTLLSTSTYIEMAEILEANAFTLSRQICP